MKDFRVIVYNDIHSNMEMFNKLHSLVRISLMTWSSLTATVLMM
jgi:hypothetical protein